MIAIPLGRLTPAKNPIQIPFGGQLSCGFPSPAVDFQLPDLSLDKLVGISLTSSIFLFRAMGDSMINAGIHDNDILVIDKAKIPTPGKVVVAVVGAEFLVKRLGMDSSGAPKLVADNPRYPDIRLGDGETLEIWGVCVWVLHSLT